MVTSSLFSLHHCLVFSPYLFTNTKCYCDIAWDKITTPYNIPFLQLLPSPALSTVRWCKIILERSPRIRWRDDTVIYVNRHNRLWRFFTWIIRHGPPCTKTDLYLVFSSLNCQSPVSENYMFRVANLEGRPVCELEHGLAWCCRATRGIVGD